MTQHFFIFCDRSDASKIETLLAGLEVHGHLHSENISNSPMTDFGGVPTLASWHCIYEADSFDRAGFISLLESIEFRVPTRVRFLRVNDLSVPYVQTLGEYVGGN